MNEKLLKKSTSIQKIFLNLFTFNKIKVRSTLILKLRTLEYVYQKFFMFRFKKHILG